MNGYLVTRIGQSLLVLAIMSFLHKMALKPLKPLITQALISSSWTFKCPYSMVNKQPRRLEN